MIWRSYFQVRSGSDLDLRSDLGRWSWSGSRSLFSWSSNALINSDTVTRYFAWVQGHKLVVEKANRREFGWLPDLSLCSGSSLHFCLNHAGITNHLRTDVIFHRQAIFFAFSTTAFPLFVVKLIITGFRSKRQLARDYCRNLLFFFNHLGLQAIEAGKSKLRKANNRKPVLWKLLFLVFLQWTWWLSTSPWLCPCWSCQAGQTHHRNISTLTVSYQRNFLVSMHFEVFGQS